MGKPHVNVSISAGTATGGLSTMTKLKFHSERIIRCKVSSGMALSRDEDYRIKSRLYFDKISSV